MFPQLKPTDLKSFWILFIFRMLTVIWDISSFGHTKYQRQYSSIITHCICVLSSHMWILIAHCLLLLYCANHKFLLINMNNERNSQVLYSEALLTNNNNDLDIRHGLWHVHPIHPTATIYTYLKWNYRNVWKRLFSEITPTGNFHGDGVIEQASQSKTCRIIFGSGKFKSISIENETI